MSETTAACIAAACFTLLALYGCANLPPPCTDLTTPFGGLSRECDPPPPDPVNQRQIQSQVEAIDSADMARRMSDAENCILRRKMMRIDHCTCYATSRMPPGSECMVETAEDEPAAVPKPPPSADTSDPDAVDRAVKSIRENEGGPHLTVVNAHFCYGMSVKWNPDVDTSNLTTERCDALLLQSAQAIDLVVGGMVGDRLPTPQHAVLIEVVYWKGRTGTLQLLPDLPEHAKNAAWASLAEDMREAGLTLPDGQRERMNRLSLVMEGKA